MLGSPLQLVHVSSPDSTKPAPPPPPDSGEEQQASGLSNVPSRDPGHNIVLASNPSKQENCCACAPAIERLHIDWQCVIATRSASDVSTYVFEMTGGWGRVALLSRVLLYAAWWRRVPIHTGLAVPRLQVVELPCGEYGEMSGFRYRRRTKLTQGLS